MKLSEVSLDDIKEFCGVTGNDSDKVLEMLKSSAVSYIKGVTALDEKQMDELPELTLAALTLINEGFINRTMSVDSNAVNPFAENILAMHRRNLI